MDITHLWKQIVYTEALQLHKSPSKNKSSNGSWDIMLFIFSRNDVTHTEGIWQRFHFSKNKKWIQFLLQQITLSSFWRNIMQSAKVSRTLEKGKECVWLLKSSQLPAYLYFHTLPYPPCLSDHFGGVCSWSKPNAVISLELIWVQKEAEPGLVLNGMVLWSFITALFGIYDK